MATMDSIKFAGGEPANFLDIATANDVNKVADALGIIARDPNVRAILVNIFGMARVDIIAEGIIEAQRRMPTAIPSSRASPARTSKRRSDLIPGQRPAGDPRRRPRRTPQRGRRGGARGLTEHPLGLGHRMRVVRIARGRMTVIPPRLGLGVLRVCRDVHPKVVSRLPGHRRGEALDARSGRDGAARIEAGNDMMNSPQRD